MNKLFYFTLQQNPPLSMRASLFIFILFFTIKTNVIGQILIKRYDFTSPIASVIQPLTLGDSAVVFADNSTVAIYNNVGEIKDSFALPTSTPNTTVKTFGLVKTINNQGIIVAKLQYPTGSSGLQNLVLLKTPLNGQAISSNVINLPTTRYVKPSITKLEDGYLISDDATSFLAKINESGTVIWSTNNVLSSQSDRSPVVLSNKNLLRFGLKSDSTNNRTTVYFIELSPSNGQVVDSGSISIPKLKGSYAQVVPTKDSGIVLLRNIKIGSNEHQIVASKLDLKRRYLQNQSFSPMKDTIYEAAFQVATDPFGNIYTAGMASFYANTALLNIVYTFAFTPDGTYRDSRFYKNFMQFPVDTNLLSLKSLSVTPNGSLFLGGGATYENFLIRLDSFGIRFPELKGRVVRDLNLNCQTNANNPPLRNFVVQAISTRSGALFYQTTDSLGNFNFGNLPVDTYRISAVTKNLLWHNCNEFKINFDRSRDTFIGSLLVQPLTGCAVLQTDITVPFLRRCFENTAYVSYQNIGSITATDARITVKLDSLMEYISASRPLSNRVGNLLTFQIGDLVEVASGRFYINFRVKCGDSTRIGQTLCVEARAYPDTLCVSTSPNWSGAKISVTGTCQNDSILFNIKNIGRGTTSAGIPYQVIEDDIVFMQGITPILPPNASRIIRLPATGKTYRVVADQETNYPLSESSKPTAAVEGCRSSSNQTITTGFFNQFIEDDDASFIDIECRELRGSYDPNDKTGLPKGTDNQHFIQKNNDIEYMIRFQNTGTDTAFTVIVRDTLPYNQLEPLTIKVGASSHPYTWKLMDKGVLEFRFDNILLVDSFRNESASNGFVKFRISQKANLVEGTKIENRAGIYFDFNAPVITNQTLHTVALSYKTQLRLDNTEVNAGNKIKIAPNPFSDWTIIEITENTPSVFQGNFELFDINGKILRRKKFIGNTYSFEKKNLPTGVYIFKISPVDGKLIAQGKAIIQ